MKHNPMRADDVVTGRRCRREARRWLLTLWLSLLAGTFTCADDGNTTAAGGRAIDFGRDVFPLLKRHCFECHGTGKQKSGLRLDAKSLAFKGGENFSSLIRPGRSAESVLIRVVAGLEDGFLMPPNSTGKPTLTTDEIGLLRRWIDQGAKWPEDVGTQPDDPLKHWSYQPVLRPALPTMNAARPIDHFIRARLSRSGLSPSPAAEPRTLIRRLSFDLRGVPPTSAEVAEFLADCEASTGVEGAYGRLVNRMLESPQLGERWARHWLDIAHYADTHGFERDQRRDNAFHFRDYVIRAFNADKPYDQFLREQIAGDVIAPDDRDAITATGFLAAGPYDFVGQVETRSDVLRRAARADDLNDIVAQVMTATVGVTVHCARCHDHKLDPITQREYYSIWAVFAGVKRGDRDINDRAAREVAARQQQIQSRQTELAAAIGKLSPSGLSVADIVSGGDGRGTQTKGLGLHPVKGTLIREKFGFHNGAVANQFVRTASKFVDGVVIPDGGPNSSVPVPVSSTGLVLKDIPDTSAAAWDAIRNGPVNSMHTTKIDGIDYDAADRTMLTLHANAAVTFDLAAIREASNSRAMRFRATVGNAGNPDRQTADFHLYVDGVLKKRRLKIERQSKGFSLDVALSVTARFLTLVATDGGDGIGSDQIFLGDPLLVPEERPDLTVEQRQELAALRAEQTQLKTELAALPSPQKVYALVTEQPVTTKLLKRGDPEQPLTEVTPGTIHCLPMLSADFGANELPEGQRRKLLADWITHPENPLTRRVIVNRLWQHHFGVGLVDTPSDFGRGGGKPTHPELLDWLADELLHPSDPAAKSWSLKHIHRLIVTSGTYRQRSDWKPAGSTIKSGSQVDPQSLDASNRWLWRMTARRLDAESLRDSVLSVSGKLNGTMHGPGYRDFEHQEEYAPVYRYVTADSPELWRRSIYRFVVRTTPQQFLTALDCPDPANLTPTRNVTTTALQALALFNNEFMLRQSGYLAERVATEAGASRAAQIRRAFELTFGRAPTPQEASAAEGLAEQQGMAAVCRGLLNANEFLYVD